MLDSGKTKKRANASGQAVPLRRQELADGKAARKQNAEALAAERDWFDSLLHTLGEGVIIADPQEEIFMINKAAAELTGWQEQEARGRPLNEVFRLLNVRTREPYQYPVVQMLKEDLAAEMPSLVVLAAKDNTQRNITIRSSLVRDEKGNVFGVAVIFCDNSKHESVSVALQESEAKYRKLVEQSLQGIVIAMGSPLRLVFANSAMANLLGYTVPELLSLSPEKTIGMIHPEDQALLFSSYQAQLSGKSALPRCEFRMARKDGSFRWLEVFSSHVEYEGKPAIQAAFMDITDRIERRLGEMEKLAATGRLAARIAHEINNPLAGIKNSFLLLKDAIPAAHRYYEYVGRIEKEIGRVTQIVRQMFDLYRPSPELPQWVRLAEVIGDVVALLDMASQERAVPITMAVTEPPQGVWLAEGMFRQILYNLIENAIEASPPGGRVEVRAAVGGSQLSVQVADGGTGIAPEIRDRLFEPFFTTKSKMSQSGLGLGLSLCKGLVDALGGSIGFESEAGQGSVFKLAIPLGRTERRVCDDRGGTDFIGG